MITKQDMSVTLGTLHTIYTERYDAYRLLDPKTSQEWAERSKLYDEYQRAYRVYKDVETLINNY